MIVIDTHTSLTEWTALFIGLSSLVSALGSAAAAFLAARNARGIEAVHNATNGMKEELVKSTGDRRYAEGRMHGEDYPRRRPIDRRAAKGKAKKRTRILKK